MPPTGTTISGNYFAGVTLNNTAYNPVSVTATIAAPSGDGLYGTWRERRRDYSAGQSATPARSAPRPDVGIRLGTDEHAVAGGVVTNTGGGVIYGYAGVFIYGPGSVTNLSGGSITGTGILTDAILITGLAQARSLTKACYLAERWRRGGSRRVGYQSAPAGASRERRRPVFKSVVPSALFSTPAQCLGGGYGVDEMTVVRSPTNPLE